MADEKLLITNEDQTQFRVAVVVFTNVRACDYGDGCNIAARAVEHALNAQMAGDDSLTFRSARKDSEFRVPVQVAEVMELGMAGGNGYLYTLPATKAYRMNGVPAGALPGSVVEARVWDEED